ncbi:MAG TPA: hemerythrin domain-containing protein [Gammaproteobacteria bacterium]|jgi:hemerythrin-like domain-containing protein|nr:hemerythrin domain-containing protein [Gammaproteobacteria bacterium]
MQAVIAVLTETHRNMERVLMLMRFQLDSLKPHNHAAAYVLLANAVGYMHRYPSLIHHPAEELIGAKLARYAPETRALCDRIREQHQRFATVEIRLQRDIRAAHASDGDGWRDIQEQGVAYCLEHATHIRLEETELFPLALRWLKGADWHEIDGQCKAMSDPLFDGKDLGRYDSLYDYLMTDGQRFDLH